MNNIIFKKIIGRFCLKTGEKRETGVNGRHGLENGRLPVGTGGLTPMHVGYMCVCLSFPILELTPPPQKKKKRNKKNKTNTKEMRRQQFLSYAARI